MYKRQNVGGVAYQVVTDKDGNALTAATDKNLSELNAKFAVSAVSYTHLDVYKRQDQVLNNVHAIWVAEIKENKVNLWHIHPDTKENRNKFGI